jgi:small subunit ribosomal protein S6
VKKYEGLFILNTAGREEGVKEMIDKITAEIAGVGGNVETVQKMDKRPFSRVADKKINAGFYVNFIFEAAPSAIEPLRSRFSMSDEVFRVMFSLAPRPKLETA